MGFFVFLYFENRQKNHKLINWAAFMQEAHSVEYFSTFRQEVGVSYVRRRNYCTVPVDVKVLAYGHVTFRVVPRLYRARRTVCHYYRGRRLHAHGLPVLVYNFDGAGTTWTPSELPEASSEYQMP